MGEYYILGHGVKEFPGYMYAVTVCATDIVDVIVSVVFDQAPGDFTAQHIWFVSTVTINGKKFGFGIGGRICAGPEDIDGRWRVVLRVHDIGGLDSLLDFVALIPMMPIRGTLVLADHEMDLEIVKMRKADSVD